MAATTCDWQISCKEVKQRGEYLLRSGQWADCSFLVGAEPNQVLVKGHKLILAMASPVFEAMFYGGMAERNDPIPILDVQPEAFKALLEYMYTDNININTFDKACELCYGAKKYMLPHLVEECTKYLWSDLYPKNACRAYEFAKLFEEPVLMDKCLQIICTQTMEVLSEVSFEEVEIGTVVTVFEQNYLNIESELELFDAAVRYANAQSYHMSNSTQVAPLIPTTPAVQAEASSATSQPEMEQSTIDLANTSQNQIVPACTNKNTSSETSQTPAPVSIRNALQKIRFLTLTPQQFASGLSRSSLLSQAEAFAILMNISSPCCGVPMPDGFSSSTEPRRKALFSASSAVSFVVDSPSPVLGESALPPPSPAGPSLPPLSPMCPNSRDKFYCRRSIVHQTDRLNNSILDCSVTFTVDKNICVIGIQVPTQGLGEDPQAMPPSGQYSELLYAHLLDADGSRLTYTHYTSRVPYRSLLEITFNRPFYIQRNKVYKVGVVFNKVGWYPLGVCCQTVVCDQVFFSFGVGQSSDSVRDGLIRSIIFSY